MIKEALIISKSQPANLLTVPTGGGRMPLNTVNIHDVGCFMYMNEHEVYENAVLAREAAGIAGLK